MTKNNLKKCDMYSLYNFMNTFYDLKLDDVRGSFTIRNVDVSIVNSIRRAIQSNIQSVAFYFDARSSVNPDFDIIKNDTPLHNEFLSQRFSMVPIHIKKDEIENWEARDRYTFQIYQTNESNKFKNVTSEHIIVKKDGATMSNAERDLIFPKNSTTGKYILLTKLPPMLNTQTVPTLDVNLTASKGCGEKHCCFSPTSLCTFMNKIVEGNEYEQAEKRYVESVMSDMKIYSDLDTKDLQQKAKAQFRTIDYQREFKKNEFGEPNEFEFKLESECALTPAQIFEDAIEYLMTRIDVLMTKIESREIDILYDDAKNYELNVSEESHTIGNLIQALVYNEYIRKHDGDDKKNITFIGYFVTHPLEKIVCFKMTSTLKKKEFTEFFIEALRHIRNMLEPNSSRGNGPKPIA